MNPNFPTWEDVSPSNGAHGLMEGFVVVCGRTGTCCGRRMAGGGGWLMTSTASTSAGGHEFISGGPQHCSSSDEPNPL